MTIRFVPRHCVVFIASSGVAVTIDNVTKSEYTYTRGCWGKSTGEKEYLSGLLSLEHFCASSDSREWLAEFTPLVPFRRAWQSLTKRR